MSRLFMSTRSDHVGERDKVSEVPRDCKKEVDGDSEVWERERTRCKVVSGRKRDGSGLSCLVTATQEDLVLLLSLVVDEGKVLMWKSRAEGVSSFLISE